MLIKSISNVNANSLIRLTMFREDSLFGFDHICQKYLESVKNSFLIMEWFIAKMVTCFPPTLMFSFGIKLKVKISNWDFEEKQAGPFERWKHRFPTIIRLLFRNKLRIVFQLKLAGTKCSSLILNFLTPHGIPIEVTFNLFLFL